MSKHIINHFVVSVIMWVIMTIIMMMVTKVTYGCDTCDVCTIILLEDLVKGGGE